MEIRVDTKDWKAYPKYVAAVLGLLGFANFGDLVRWARSTLATSPAAVTPQALQEEAQARKAGDSAILVRIREGEARDSSSNARVEKAVGKLATYVLKVPQVAKYAEEEDRTDSLRRIEDRRRARRLWDREARGPGWSDRDIR